jgi:Acid sphingomyelin phosphodiesterase C-terminal region
MNIKSYYMNLTLANSINQPTWALLHDYTSYYGLPDLRPDNIYSLALRLRNNEAAARQYLWDEIRRAKPTMPDTCDTDCRN